jgi:hypothetical protein
LQGFIPFPAGKNKTFLVKVIEPRRNEVNEGAQAEMGGRTMRPPMSEFPMSKALASVPIERVENAILLIRGEKVILDTDLAALYDVETRALL